MQTPCNHTKILLQRNGSDQASRFLEALKPESVKIHDLTVKDWMKFAFDFAKEVNYFNLNNQTDGHWQDFLLKEPDIEKALQLSDKSELTPHLTLLFSFLKLTETSQNHLNTFTKRHLDFYYKQVLNLKKNEAGADMAHVIFELAKNIGSVKIDEGTGLDAGKDSSGVKIAYETVQEFIPNKAKVMALKSIYPHETGIAYAEIANSYDGLGKDFPGGEVKWYPFGHPAPQVSPALPPDYPTLPKAKTGFAIASPLLLLKEGLRKVTFTIELEKLGGKTLPQEIASSAFDVLFSGEKEWVRGTVTNISGKNNPLAQLIVQVTLDESKPAIIPYNKDTLLENLISVSPIARFILKNEDSSEGFNFYKNFKNFNVKSFKIDVDVSNITKVVAENDQGTLDAKKPFMPFGTNPVKGSNFYLGLSEALNKPWNEVTINLNWKDTPFYDGKDDHIKENYLAYRKNYLTNLSKNTYNLTVSDEVKTGPVLTETSIMESSKSFVIEGLPFYVFDDGLIVNSSSHFTMDADVLESGKWATKVTDKTLFEKSGDGYNCSVSIKPNESSVQTGIKNPFSLGLTHSYYLYSQVLQNFDYAKQTQIKQSKTAIKDLIFSAIAPENFAAGPKDGFIKLTLNQGFLHQLFPRIYAIAMAKEGKDTLIPNVPYTPVVESVTIGYKASTEKSFTMASDEKSLLNSFLDESLEFFHEVPFGQSEQHPYLKSQQPFLGTTSCKLFPQFPSAELLIGIEGVENLQQLSLLVQVLEGSENPEPMAEFDENNKLGYYILCNNEWMPLDLTYLIANETDNFLRSGLLKFNIPVEATSDNTILPSGLHWLKVTNSLSFDNVCQVVAIIAQATDVNFKNNGNSLDHLLNGLPAGTISKLVNRVSQVKSVSQPFNSFGGRPEETDDEFYRRISERLRHKNRAITVWDYEHLVLQEFPYVYKAHCLKHTKGEDFLSPGDVTLVVVPNTINKNSFNPFKPRISRTKRNDIAHYINSLNTLHVSVSVENPAYVEVKVKLNVKFHFGKDENFYREQLKTDISKFLAPWAFEETAGINFGASLHQSTLLYYIEKLEYVDYVSKFQLLIEDGKNGFGEPRFTPVKKAVPKNLKTVLTSANPQSHEVTVTSKTECEVV